MQRSNTKRAIQVAEQIMFELNTILREDIADPRLAMLTVTGVRLNADFSIAEVLYTHLAGPTKKIKIEASLNKAKGYFRSQIGKRLNLRTSPELRFIWDTFLEGMVYENSIPDSL